MDKFKKIGYQLIPLLFILLITGILTYIVICYRGFSFDVSEEPPIPIVGIGAQELTTISILFYISFWIVYELRYIPQYLCDKFCPCGNNKQQKGSNNQKLNKLCNKFCNFIVPSACKILYTLGFRIDIFSTTRNDSEEMQEKAKVTRTFGTFLIGFCTIFITLIFGFSDKLASINPYYLVLIPCLQLIALILLIIGVDSFDTCLNKFPKNELIYEYYMRGIRLFYISMQMILLSFLIIAFLIHWILTVSMISIFLLFGYTYWFPGTYKEFEENLCEHCQDKKRGCLFSIGANIESDLRSGNISDNLKDIFQTKGFSVSQDAEVTGKDANEWEISDGKPVKFIVKKEDGELNVYKIDE